MEVRPGGGARQAPEEEHARRLYAKPLHAVDVGQALGLARRLPRRADELRVAPAHGEGDRHDDELENGTGMIPKCVERHKCNGLQHPGKLYREGRLHIGRCITSVWTSHAPVDVHEMLSC